MSIIRQIPLPVLLATVLTLGIGCIQGNAETLTASEFEETKPFRSTTSQISTLTHIIVTDDGVIIPIVADGVIYPPEIKSDENRVFLTLQGLELAPSISIESRNTRPEASLVKRRLRVKQTEPGVVEISLTAGQQEWTLTPYNQGLSLVPTAIARSQWSAPTVGQAELSSEMPQAFPVKEDMVATEENLPEQTTVLSPLSGPNSLGIPEEVDEVKIIAQAERKVEIKNVEELQIVSAPVIPSNLYVKNPNDDNQENADSEQPKLVAEVVEQIPSNSSEIMASNETNNEIQEVTSTKVASVPTSAVSPGYSNNFPFLLAQSPPGQSTVEELREQLLIPPIDDAKLARVYYPTLTFGVPSAFGPSWGDIYISGTGATPGNDRDGQVDGSISMGFGLGDPVENVGLNFAYNIGSINNFGQNGTFDMSASRMVYQDPITAVAIAAGWSDFARYGGNAVQDSTVWGTVTSYSFLRPDDPVNKLPLLLSLGVGGGYFRQDPASTGVFGGVGLQIAPQVGVGIQWSGVGLNLGLSFVPVPTIPLTLTATGTDLTNNSPGGTRFVFSLSYGFNFLPSPGSR
ncbi:hypothetical protein [Synechocystis sp. CACIAM 05]|uniref:hypothetical protein n=1 Tax=Synechocystis sp. CACIAM 05 TaxID=1933929 RepID=UPI00138E9077|nr:hypothetical protein [Synechocystis sp. CACIAM 05]QHV01373.1 hypothetical protein BWK47_15380 [Synechocystis sp. CACIAM 05]